MTVHWGQLWLGKDVARGRHPKGYTSCKHALKGLCKGHSPIETIPVIGTLP